MSTKPTTNPSAQWPDKVPVSGLALLKRLVPVKIGTGPTAYWVFREGVEASGVFIKQST